MPSVSSRKNVCTPALMLGVFIWLALGGFNHGKVIRLEAVDDILRPVKAKVESNWLAKKLVDVNYVVPDVECKQNETSPRKYAAAFLKGDIDFPGIEVHDRIERHNSGQAFISEIECHHVADAKVEIGRHFARNANHLR